MCLTFPLNSGAHVSGSWRRCRRSELGEGCSQVEAESSLSFFTFQKWEQIHADLQQEELAHSCAYTVDFLHERLQRVNEQILFQCNLDDPR